MKTLFSLYDIIYYFAVSLFNKVSVKNCIIKMAMSQQMVDF